MSISIFFSHPRPASAAFEALPTQPTEAWAALTTSCARHDIPTDAHLA